jgi:tetratricopeptide (TPR) repeat protein
MAVSQDLVDAMQESFKAGNFEEAIGRCSEILAAEPTHPLALHIFGLVHARLGDHAGAIEWIRKAVAARPGAALFHLNLSESYRNQGDWRRALGSCRMAIKLWPQYPEAFNTLGLIHYGQGLYTEAAEEFRRALAIRPKMTDAHNNLGLAYQQLGEHDAAIHHYQTSIDLEPQSTRARTNLGLLLIELGRAEEALPHLGEVARIQPEMAAVQHNLGNAFRMLDRGIEARTAYLEALRLEPDLPLTHLHIGMSLRREGLLAEAVVWYDMALELAPKNWFFWEQAAELHAERHEYRKAIPCWQKVLELSPAQKPMVHLNLGWAFQEESRIPEARAQYEFVKQLHPDWALVWVYLGSLQEEAGEIAEAEISFREAIRLNLALPQSHARLGGLLREKTPDPDIAAIRERLTDLGLDKSVRPRLLFALAQIHDGRREFPQAAEYLRQANALTLEMAGNRRRDYNSQEHEKFIDGLIQGFGDSYFKRLAGSGISTRKPVFVFGLPRSGTTLVEQVLASHPQIYGAGELKIARQVFESIPAAMSRFDSVIDCIPLLDAECVGRLAEQHLQQLTELDSENHDRIVDKMIENYIYLGSIYSMFPEATFIHCCRDLRDIAVSCWMTDFRVLTWANDFQHIASRFHQYRRLMNHWEAVFPTVIHRVDYEDTVADLESVAKRLLQACSLEWNPVCLDFHRTQRTVRTASVTQVRQPIYKKSVARWKNYEQELGELFRILPLN